MLKMKRVPVRDVVVCALFATNPNSPNYDTGEAGTKGDPEFLDKQQAREDQPGCLPATALYRLRLAA